jgi:3-isopropylmalate/(R)-2-methylmalate dehydratase large subunit
MSQTLYDMIWSDHLVDEQQDGTCLIYVDRHIVHEVDSPQAFDGLRRAGLRVRAPEKTLMVVDHNVPTSDRRQPNPDAIRSLSMEGRMTVCNMSVEAGARTGIMAPDEKTYEFLKDRPKSPKGKAWDEAMRYWDKLRSSEGAQFDREIRLDVTDLPPLVTWGTSPEQVVSITGRVPKPVDIADDKKRRAAERSLAYMGLKGGEKIAEIALDRVFIGSCTSSRIEDLREVARVVNGKTVNANVSAMIVPGSGLAKAQAEAEGLAEIFVKAGFDWREPGCSMYLAMNADKLKPGERCASTSNRNFEGRQGYKGRTHLVSPAMAAAAAIVGRFVDVRKWD